MAALLGSEVMGTAAAKRPAGAYVGRPIKRAAMMNKPPIMAARTTAASAPTSTVQRATPIRATQAEPRKPAIGRLPLRRISANMAQAEALLQPKSQIKNQTGRGFSD